MQKRLGIVIKHFSKHTSEPTGRIFSAFYLQFILLYLSLKLLLGGMGPKTRLWCSLKDNYERALLPSVVVHVHIQGGLTRVPL